MAEKSKYIQCVLIQKSATRTSFIPEKFAKLGGVVRLRDGEKWSEPWVVLHTGAESFIDDLDIGKSIRQHRNRTGDSILKD